MSCRLTVPDFPPKTCTTWSPLQVVTLLRRREIGEATKGNNKSPTKMFAASIGVRSSWVRHGAYRTPVSCIYQRWSAGFNKKKHRSCLFHKSGPPAGERASQLRLVVLRSITVSRGGRSGDTYVASPCLRLFFCNRFCLGLGDWFVSGSRSPSLLQFFAEHEVETAPPVRLGEDKAIIWAAVNHPPQLVCWRAQKRHAAMARWL